MTSREDGSAKQERGSKPRRGSATRALTEPAGRAGRGRRQHHSGRGGRDHRARHGDQCGPAGTRLSPGPLAHPARWPGGREPGVVQRQR
ncbi:hypothetical protein G5V59_14045 [Nocardioides sp. W3-2-3]|uniref:hypothetical protein n=1 Tax=Nocardioides convexus TaxID=2712224 RepID=UPI002418AD90|nr:hypothetical protein [Nocardioides convexus]NHA00739.1 hypothetical protein [Nocardioides convexus]